MMCGIFAYAGADQVDNAALCEVATLAAMRGPHSHGYAWCTDDGEILYDRGWGDARRAVPDLSRLMTRAIIGHSRLATTGLSNGGAPELRDTAPFVVGEVAIVHNGTVRKYKEISQRHRLDLVTGCDSEVIAHLLNKKLHRAPALPLSALLGMVADEIDEGRPFVVVALDHRGQVAAIRRELPLYAFNEEGGNFLCSRPRGQSIRIKEGYCWGYPNVLMRVA